MSKHETSVGLEGIDIYRPRCSCGWSSKGSYTGMEGAERGAYHHTLFAEGVALMAQAAAGFNES